MRRPRIKRTTEPIETPDGDVYLLRPSAGNDIRIEKPDEEERRLLAALDGEHTLEQLQEEFGEKAVGDLIAQLQELEVVEDARRRRPARRRRSWRASTASCATSATSAAGGPTPSECQRAAARGEGRGARRRRARRLGGLGAGLHAGSARCG